MTDCGAGSCPTIYRAENGQLYVQGRRADDDLRVALGLGASEDAVEIPTALLEQAFSTLTREREARQTGRSGD